MREKLQAMIDRNCTPDPDTEGIAMAILYPNGIDGEAKGGGLGGNALFDKTKCCDVFNDVIVDDLNMYEQRSDRVKL